MKEQIINLLKERLYNSFTQALIKLTLPSYIVIKILLAVSSLGLCALASYLVVQSIFEYLSFGVSTTSRTIYETPTLFPKVTFCNFNSLTTQYAYNLTQTIGQYDNLIGANLPDDEKKKLGHDLSDILIDCQFDLSECNLNDFKWSYDPWFGNCYTFNTNSDFYSKRSNIAGYKFGLHLTLYVNLYEKLKNEYLLTYPPIGFGAIVRIGNNSFSTLSDTNGLFASPGYNTFISVDREFKSMLPKPYSECELDPNSSYLYDLIAESKYVFSQEFCLIQCMQKNIIHKYDCSFPLFPSIFNSSWCNSTVIYAILSPSNNSFDSDFINKVCLPLCPLECSHTLYKLSLSSNQLNGNSYIIKIQNNSKLASDFITKDIDAETAGKSIAQLTIYYDSLSYTESIESPQMNIVSLIGSIGGNLGLFLGVSVFSLWEIIEVVIEIFLIY